MAQFGQANRPRGSSVAGLMGMKLVKRGKAGKIIDRASSTKGKQKPMPAALARLFVTAHDPFGCGEAGCTQCAEFWRDERDERADRKIREEKGE